MKFPFVILSFFLIYISESYAGQIHDIVRGSPHGATSFDTQKLEQLIKDHPDMINEQDEEGQTPLHLAIEIGNTPILNVLIKNGADLTLLNNRGSTAFSLVDTEGYPKSYPYSHIAETIRSPEGKQFISQHYFSIGRRIPNDPLHSDRPPMLIAVHQTKEYAPDFDKPLSSCASYVSASDEILSKMYNLGLPIAFLTSTGSRDLDEWVTGKNVQATVCKPSVSGDHLLLSTSEVIVIGANWSRCHLHAVTKAMHLHFLSKSDPFTVHLPVKAIHIARPIDAQDVPPQFKSRLLRFLSDEEKIKEVERTFLSDSSWVDTGFHYNSKRYRFQIFLDGRLKSTVGTGANEVNLKIWNEFDPAKNLDKFKK